MDEHQGKAFKGEKRWNWKGGKPKCLDCGKELSNYGYTRCKKCSVIGKNNNFFNRHHSDETIKRIVETKKTNYKKENHYNWKGGISINPYPQEFNRKLKEEIRKRDNYICQICGKTEVEQLEELNRVLCVNHIDFNKNNCSPENLNTLCIRCNVKINYDREKYINYFQKRINYA